jgi:hypothetical protein
MYIFQAMEPNFGGSLSLAEPNFQTPTPLALLVDEGIRFWQGNNV